MMPEVQKKLKRTYTHDRKRLIEREREKLRGWIKVRGGDESAKMCGHFNAKWKLVLEYFRKCSRQYLLFAYFA